MNKKEMAAKKKKKKEHPPSPRSILYLGLSAPFTDGRTQPRCQLQPHGQLTRACMARHLRVDSAGG